MGSLPRSLPLQVVETKLLTRRLTHGSSIHLKLEAGLSPWALNDGVTLGLELPLNRRKEGFCDGCINSVLLFFYQPSAKDLNTLTSLTGHGEGNKLIFRAMLSSVLNSHQLEKPNMALWSIRQNSGVWRFVQNGVWIQVPCMLVPWTIKSLHCYLFPELQNA